MMLVKGVFFVIAAVVLIIIAMTYEDAVDKDKKEDARRHHK